MSIVRQNLMEIQGYTPYCGGCTWTEWPRTKFNGTQFECPCCDWVSSFDDAFIAKYKEKWNL